MKLADLKAPFPKEDVEWRAQILTRDGDKAMALAYIDARAVMDRLDKVCGPENWQTEYHETASGRVICSLSIRIGDQWVSKGDGAGSTDIEGDKGGISSALKRAAVAWGIGRYLYDMPTPWVPCETYERGGKKHWSKWTKSPWDFVKSPPKQEAAKPPASEPQEDRKRILNQKLSMIPSLVSKAEIDSFVLGLDEWLQKEPAIKRDVTKRREDLKKALAGDDPARGMAAG